MGKRPGMALDVALARELAEREGAKAVVHGQIAAVGRGYVLSAELVSAPDGATLVALREDAKDDGAIIAAVDRLSARLRERIGESLRAIRASEPLEQVTTGSLEALRKYSQALKANDAGQFARAVSLVEEVISLDTTFAMAYRKLAVVLTNTDAAPSRIAEAAAKAFRHRDRLTPLERYLAEGFYYYRTEFDLSKVESAYRSALELDPENYVALNNLALALSTTRRFAEAESLTLRGIAVVPNATLYVNATQAQIAQGKLAEAARTVESFAGKAPQNPLAFYLRAGLAGARRDFDSAEAIVRAEAQLVPDPALQEQTAYVLAHLSLVRGRLADAERHAAAAAVALAEGRVQDAISGYRAWYADDNCAVCGLFELGRAYERAGERDSALAVYERAVTTPGLVRLFEEAATLGPTYKRLGELYEERGQLDKARDYYGRFVDLWKNADPELQPMVRDVKRRLARLTAEGAK